MPRTFPGIPIAQLLAPVPAFVDEAPVSADKRIFFTCAVAVLVVGGWTVPAEAQRGGRVRVIAPSRVVVVGGGFYDPFWYYDPWWGSPYQWGPYPYPAYPPYRYYRDPGASVRLEVKPKEAEVFVDGYYAGIVDDFDGAFQRLRVEPGEHEITLYLDGYRTVRQKVYLTPNNTFKIKYALERLAAGAVGVCRDPYGGQCQPGELAALRQRQPRIGLARCRGTHAGQSLQQLVIREP